MSLRDEIVQGFEEVQIKLSEKVLEKCQDLCETYQLSAEDLIDEWLAYSATILCGVELNLDTLGKLERERFLKRLNASKTITATPKSNYVTPRKTTTQIYSEPMDTTPSFAAPAAAEETPSKKYSERTNAGKVQLSFGPCFKNNFTRRSSEKLSVTIENYTTDSNWYMYEMPMVRRELRHAQALKISEELVSNWKKYFGDNTDNLFPVQICDGDFRKLDVNFLNVEFLTEERTRLGHILELNVDKVENFAFFPGQVVLVEGNIVQKYLVAEKLHTELDLLPSAAEKRTFNEPIQIVTASGPFTFSENLLYEPLRDLLEYVVEHKPNFLILFGPFIDENSDCVFFEQTFDDMFESIIGGIMYKLEDVDVQVILVPSHKDVHHDVIFPTSPYRLQQKYDDRLILAPDPAVLDLNGVCVALSSADCLRHMHEVELVQNKFDLNVQNFEKRLISHMFNHRSFYPLYQPHPHILVDYQRLNSMGKLERLPDLMILPSDLRFYAKSVRKCIAVNPQKMCRGEVGGTFARIEIQPGEKPISERILCQIVNL